MYDKLNVSQVICFSKKTHIAEGNRISYKIISFKFIRETASVHILGILTNRNKIIIHSCHYCVI